MRFHMFVLGCLIAAGCTAEVSGYRTPISARVQEACGELDSICASGGDCLPKLAFCGPKTGSMMTELFIIEDTCKTACLGTRPCIKDCKAKRVAAVTTIIARTDTNDDGVEGEGTSACSSLSTTCAATGQACDADEFFCSAPPPPSSSCATELADCKASCNHERSCTRECRKQYRLCLDGTPTTPPPDAGTTPPPPTTYDLTYGITAGSTGMGTITVNPAGASCGASCSTYAAGSMVTLTATASTGSTFTNWVGCTSTTNTCTVTMNAAMTVTATFTASTTTTSYNLTYGPTAGSTGTGTIAVNPVGTSCGTSCYAYASGTMVKLTATASTGSTFTKWVGCASTTNTCTVTMNAAMTVTATFTKNAPALTYTADIQPKMAGLCDGCHGGGGSLPGNYATDSYTGLFGNGSDNTPNIIAGNASSLFVTKIAGNHKNVLTLYPGFDKTVSDWVVLNAAAK